MKTAIKEGRIIRTAITPDNLRQVFDKWIEKVGNELQGVLPADYALLFFADLMHDGAKPVVANLPARLLFENIEALTPVFFLNGKNYELGSERGYRNFWQMYDRPPDQE